MTTPIFQGYQWAAGFNNAAGLKAVEMDVPVFRNMPFYVHAIGSWDEGVARARADKLVTIGGFQRFAWGVDLFGDAQYNYIQSTYTAGGTGLSAKMTVRTLNRAGAFANYSAVLILPKKTELERIWNAYRSVVLQFVVEAAL